jgi:hypothetical protein
MPELTRRRSADAPEESWQVFYGDVRVGTIAKRIGIPRDRHPWGWSCGFYPGSRPGDHETGTAATFDEARARFEAAWGQFLPKRTEADFQEWRDHRDWTAEKYRRFDRGERMPSDWKPHNISAAKAPTTAANQKPIPTRMPNQTTQLNPSRNFMLLSPLW